MCDNHEFRLLVAPLQGLTEAAWRAVHWRMFGAEQGDVEYFTPFIRVEHGAVRPRDLRDFTSDLNAGMNLTPQIIFKNEDEWKMLVETLVQAGATRIDMNLGCPFVPQVKKGRGAGTLTHPDMLGRIALAMKDYFQIEFSLKMRLGVKEPSEALELTDIINEMRLRHVVVHPRTASQQYKGALHVDALAQFKSAIRHPLVFNGDVTTPAQLQAMEGVYAGVMVGRGLLARPSLFAEFRAGKMLTDIELNELFLNLIQDTSSLLEQRLCGATQLRDKMKAYWLYAPSTLDQNIVKAGKKGLFNKA